MTDAPSALSWVRRWRFAVAWCILATVVVGISGGGQALASAL